MVDLESIGNIEPACAMIGMAVVGGVCCTIAAAFCWQRAAARTAQYRDWAAGLEKQTSEPDGNELFDRWTEAAQRATRIRMARIATALWCVAAAAHAGIAGMAEAGCG